MLRGNMFTYAFQIEKTIEYNAHDQIVEITDLVNLLKAFCFQYENNKETFSPEVVAILEQVYDEAKSIIE